MLTRPWPFLPKRSKSGRETKYDLFFGMLDDVGVGYYLANGVGMTSNGLSPLEFHPNAWPSAESLFR
jgi:hypothetical protein